MIFANKHEIISVWKRQQKLYSLVNSLCGTHKQNPMPKAADDQRQAEEFSEYSYDKIANIRGALKTYEFYHPTGKCRGQMTSFTPVSEDEVKKAILSLATKSRELDDILPSIHQAKSKRMYGHNYENYECITYVRTFRVIVEDG